MPRPKCPEPECSSPRSIRPTGQAQPGQAQAGRTGAHNQEVVHYIANNLLLGNQAEVELGQLAAQQAENDQVKAFGQMMVKEHQQMIQELQRVAGTRGATSKSDSPSSGAHTYS